MLHSSASKSAPGQKLWLCEIDTWRCILNQFWSGLRRFIPILFNEPLIKPREMFQLINSNPWTKTSKVDEFSQSSSLIDLGFFALSLWSSQTLVEVVRGSQSQITVWNHWFGDFRDVSHMIRQLCYVTVLSVPPLKHQSLLLGSMTPTISHSLILISLTGCETPTIKRYLFFPIDIILTNPTT